MYLIVLNDWKHNRDFHVLPGLTFSSFHNWDISFTFLVWRVTWVVRDTNGVRRKVIRQSGTRGKKQHGA